ncbi:MAG: MFS transporter [Pseudomonadota bacterium]
MAQGFYRMNAPWLAAAALMTFGSSFGQTFFISLFAGGIRAEFGLSDGDWGILYTAATLGSAAILVQAGRLADSVALRPLLLGTVALYAAALVLMALAPSALWLGLGVLGLRFCGQGMMSHLAMTATARWFRANRGRAVAIAVLGFPAGEALLPPVAVLLIGAVGWRDGWLLAAGTLLCVVLPVLLLLLARGGRVPQGEGGHESAAGMDGRHWTRRRVLSHWAFWALMPGGCWRRASSALSPSSIRSMSRRFGAGISRRWRRATRSMPRCRSSRRWRRDVSSIATACCAFCP